MSRAVEPYTIYPVKPTTCKHTTRNHRRGEQRETVCGVKTETGIRTRGQRYVLPRCAEHIPAGSVVYVEPQVEEVPA